MKTSTRSASRHQTAKQAAYLFFLRNAGYSYDPKTQTRQQGRSETARKLAQAERDARALGYWFDWSPDTEECLGCECGSPDCKCSTGEPHETYWCQMITAEGASVQSLGGICEPSREYRRVVEAELALEQLG